MQFEDHPRAGRIVGHPCVLVSDSTDSKGHGRIKSRTVIKIKTENKDMSLTTTSLCSGLRAGAMLGLHMIETAKKTSQTISTTLYDAV